MLFNDILILVNEIPDKVKKKSVFVLSAVVPLDTCMLEEYSEQNESAIPKPRGVDTDNLFLICQQGQSDPLIIVCETQKQKVKWMADIFVQIEKTAT